MKHELVGCVSVDSLDDVDFSLDRPWLATERPKGRPGTADATGHVLDIKNEEALVVLLLALKTDTFTTNVLTSRAV